MPSVGVFQAYRRTSFGGKAKKEDEGKESKEEKGRKGASRDIQANLMSKRSHLMRGPHELTTSASCRYHPL
ncbi:hypothetical protein GW17_00059123 [Ensete ventricosum]|nr:hypothetical protein GW17_00059123 [Ensete ventricosum]RZS23055.1 hypothetical protein BHM03_00055900 [Ensete ventricosum]